MIVVGKPAPDLAGTVEFFWSGTGDGRVGRTFTKCFPMVTWTSIFRFSASGSRLVLLGPATEKVSITVDEASEYFGIRFRVGQAPRLADIRLPDLINAHLDLSHISGEKVASLAERFQSMPDHQSRQRLMASFLRDCRPLVEDERCRKAAAVLESHGGILRVDALSAGLVFMCARSNGSFCPSSEYLPND